VHTHQRNSILWFHSTWPPPCYPFSTSLDEYLKIPFVVTPTSHNLENTSGKPTTDYTPQSQVEFPIRTIVHNVPRLPNSPTNVEEGNLSRSIRTSHNLYSHIENTSQSEPQLKECSCSFVIPSHNSRDVIPSHNSRNATHLPSISSHNSRETVPCNNSRNTSASQSLRYHPKPCRSHTYKSTKVLPLHYRLALGES